MDWLEGGKGWLPKGVLLVHVLLTVSTSMWGVLLQCALERRTHINILKGRHVVVMSPILFPNSIPLPFIWVTKKKLLQPLLPNPPPPRKSQTHPSRFGHVQDVLGELARESRSTLLASSGGARPPTADPRAGEGEETRRRWPSAVPRNPKGRGCNQRLPKMSRCHKPEIIGFQLCNCIFYMSLSFVMLPGL